MLNATALSHPVTQAKFMEAGRQLVSRRKSVVIIHNSKGEHLATVYRLLSGKLVALTMTGQDITQILSLPSQPS